MMAKQAGAPTVRSVRPDAPADLAALCDALLRTDPKARPSMAEVAARLAARGVVIVPAGSASPTVATTQRPIFVGRTDVLKSLDDAYEEARAGTLSVVHLRGASGLGKTAVVRAAFETFAERPMILVGRCYQRESVPYKAFDAVIDDLTRHLLAMPAAEVAVLAPRDAAALARIFPVLDRVPTIAQAPRRFDDDTAPLVVRRRGFTALRELFARVSDRRPLVVFLDDLQWGDPDSAGLLADLLAPPDPPAVLFVLAYRTDEAASSPFLAELERRTAVVGVGGTKRTIALSKLSPEETTALASKLLQGHDRADELAAKIGRESLGSPFFLGELAQYARSDATDGEVASVGLEGLIDRRVSQLPADARRLLQLTSVLGRQASREVLARAAALSDDDTAQAIVRLRTVNLVRVGGLRGELVEPFHDRIRETVVAALDASALEALSRSLALALNADPHADPEHLYRLFRAAKMPERALDAVKRAAEKSEQALAFDRAAELWGEALALSDPSASDRRRLLAAQADAFANAGHGADAAPLYLQLAAMEPGIAGVALKRRGAEQLLFAGHIREGMEVVRDVLTFVDMQLPRSPIRALVRLLVLRAFLLVRGTTFRRRDESTIPHADLARVDALFGIARALTMVDTLYGSYFSAQYRRLALALGEPSRIVMALEGTAGHLVTTDPRKRPRALALHARAAEIVATLPADRVAELTIYRRFCRGMTDVLSGHWVGATERFLETLELAGGNRGQMWEVDSSMFMWVYAAGKRGHYREMAERLPGYLRDATDRGDTYLSTNLAVGEGSTLWLVRDDPKHARAVVEEALDDWQRMRGNDMLDLPRWWANCSLITIDHYARDWSAGLARAQTLDGKLQRSVVRAVQSVRSLTYVLLARAELHALDATGDAHRWPAIRSARDRAAKSCVPAYDSLLALLDAGIAAKMGDRARSIELLRRAIDRATEWHMESYVAFARVRLASLTGDEALAEQGRAWLAGQGVRQPDVFVDAHAPGFTSTIAATPSSLAR
jgi:hypothetical protein